MRYVIVNSDDWEALYVDGRKVAEGHSISRHDLAAHIDDFAVRDTEPDVMAAQGTFGAEFPERLDQYGPWCHDLLDRMAQRVSD